VDVIECICDILDGHGLILALVGSLDYLTKAALALNLQELILVGDALPDGWQAL